MKRLDYFLFESGKYLSRTKAAEAIKRGEVKVDGVLADKPSLDVSLDSKIEIISTQAFASNGGYKLEKAIDDFSLEISGNFVDIGASTGGFTDCLLKHGADFVYAVDVGDSQLAPNLKSDKRVFVMDKTNARMLTAADFDKIVDGIVCDVSFISLTHILPVIYDVLRSEGISVTLIKPQFECGRRALNSNGIVTSKSDRLSAVKKIYDCGVALGLNPIKFTTAPIRERKNIEFLMLWRKGGDKRLDFNEVINGVK